MTEQFKKQVIEDLDYIRTEYAKYEPKLEKKEYAFNFWILTKLYNMDEDCVYDNITEYNDKCIDCYVHYTDNKELYIIQNKYYENTETIETEKVSDFLKRPLTSLAKGNYKNKELQKIFNNAISDSEYKIYLHFYAFNTVEKEDIKNLVNDFNNYDKSRYKCQLEAEYCNINNIKRLYYGEAYKNKTRLEYNFKTLTKGTFAVVREEWEVGIRPSFYIITPVTEIYRLFKKAKEHDYPLFNDNIREWLGNNAINGDIIKTLLSEDDRKDFLYYNNGITMVYEDSGRDKIEDGERIIPLINPQIVNGCQTTNSIYQALKDYDDNNKEELDKKFSDAFVMVKALKTDSSSDKNFAEVLMKYTNKQNAIPEKAFQSKSAYFERIQKSFIEKGFLLEVKPSDKAKNKEMYKDKKKLHELTVKANVVSEKFGITLTTLSDISIPLDKLLVVALAFLKDGYYAYTKKCYLLKYGADLYKNFSLCLLDNITVNSLIYIYLFYQKAEIDKKKNDGRNPIPYYVLSFLGRYLKEENTENKNKIMSCIFENTETIDTVYQWIKGITEEYSPEYYKRYGENGDYNRMIKKEIDWQIFNHIKELSIRYNKPQKIDNLQAIIDNCKNN